MKTAIISLSASTLLFSLGIGSLALFHNPAQAPVVEGKDEPILLHRMVVTATPLPD